MPDMLFGPFVTWQLGPSGGRERCGGCAASHTHSGQPVKDVLIKEEKKKQEKKTYLGARDMSFVKTREVQSYGVGTEVMWSRCGFNLCVAPLYGNRGVLVFRRAGKRGCPERGAEWTGKLRLGAEGLQRVWIGILVNYKLEFNYLSILAYIRKGNGDVQWSG